MLKTETLPKTSYGSDNSDCPHLSHSNVRYWKEMQQCLHGSQRQCKPLTLFPAKMSYKFGREQAEILTLENSRGTRSLGWGAQGGGDNVIRKCN